MHLPAGHAELTGDLEAVVRDELNVDSLELAAELGEVLDYELVPNFRLLGPRLGPRVQALRAALGSVDGPAAAEALGAGRPVVVQLEDGTVELTGEEVELRVRAQQGFSVSRDGAEVVALDLTLDDDLVRRGVAREVVRIVQDLRKASGFDVSDRIHLFAKGLDDLGGDLVDDIAHDVLAVDVAVGPPPDGTGGDGAEVERGEGPPAMVWVAKA
jgi:isoleucyl-tRNA synthetase